MESKWVDFKAIKDQVSMQMVVDRYGLTLKRIGNELRGPCPIHRGTNNKHFTANFSKNVFKCFFARCKAQGNVLDFVAAMESCSIREGAIKLSDWFAVGDVEEKESDASSPVSLEIQKGIYVDNQERMIEVLGVARLFDNSERAVVMRELFEEFRLLFAPIDNDGSAADQLDQLTLKLVKSF